MRCLLCFAALSAAALASAQTAVTPPSASSSDLPSPDVHYAGPGVTAPELIPRDETIEPPAHCKHFDGSSLLHVVVGKDGLASQYFFLRPTSSDVDKVAIALIQLDRFKPGTVNGEPAAVAITNKVKIEGCLDTVKNGDGDGHYIFKLRSMPEQVVALESSLPELPDTPLHPHVVPDASGVTPPRAINMVDAQFSDEARKKGINGACIITLTVDVHGMPQNLQLRRCPDPSLNENSLSAVNKYRFRPAMKNGVPVPAPITVEVNFKIYAPTP